MGTVTSRFKNFKASPADYDEDTDDTYPVNLDKVFEDINPFGWFQVM